MDDISYLFAVEAEQFLMAGMAEEAIELCNRGLEVFPGYAAAVSVLAQAHKALGQKDIAIKLIDEAKENIPATSVNYILETLDNSNIVYNSSPIIPNYEFEEENEIIESNKEEFENDEFDLIESVEENEILESNEEELKNDEFDLIESVEENEILESNEEEFENDEPDLIESLEEIETSEPFQDLIENEISSESQDEILFNTNHIIESEDKNNGEISSAQPLNRDKISFSSNLDIIPGLEKLKINKTKMIFGGSKIQNIDKFQKIAKQQSNFISIMNSLENAVPIKSELIIKKESRNAPVMITDTIAGILYQQGAFMEAKKAYSELSDKYPNKSDFYKKKISEIESKLNG